VAKPAKYVPKHRAAKHRAEGPALLPTLPKKAFVGSLAAVAVAGTGAVVVSAASGSPAPEKAPQIAAAANITPLEHAQRSAAVSRSLARPQVVGTPTPTPKPTPTQTPTPTPTPQPMPYVSPGSARAIAQSMMAAHGWDGGQFSCLDQLWNRESHWNVYAANRSGAYGIPQALPGSKMGEGWQNNATVQITWGLGYISRRYGTPCGAWGHSLSTGWY
jgi:hypothetical protein